MHQRAGGSSIRTLHLSIAFLLCLAALPSALADEAAAECEEGQPWIGYRTSEPARATAEPMLEDAGFGFDACEGEQWDGQDAVQPGWSAPCAGYLHTVPEEAAAGMCLGADPNGMSGQDPLAPLGFRASTSELREGYLAANVVLVARVAVYVGTCGEDERGLEGETSCQGARELRTGVYARDNTPGNVLATLVQCSTQIICYVSEGDCSHETYVRSAMTGERMCGRDNTAFGVSLILL